MRTFARFMDRLILFDIDGTLTRTQNGYLPFNEALLKTFGIPGDIRTVVPDGNTDPLIVEEIFARTELRIEITSEQWQRFAGTLHDSYASAVRNGSTQVKQLPGSSALLQMLAQVRGLRQSVVTGNMEVIANVKLATAGVSSYFCRGGYGSDSRNRADLPKIAKVRCESAAGRAIRPD
ncbi:MAG TPA: haloacid dehalogenase-like hydrolase, partial [Candidatus Binatia bacterium]|nr:haloacid dehalogenase-like hydrolase [Candidatus Binatia bacterium]